MKRILTKENIRQFISYFWVGGTAALVEWVTFYLLERFTGISYLLATVLAFVVSTTVNWILGRTFTFKESRYTEKRGKEFFLVFLVSAIGLGLNLLLMFFFVSGLGMDTDLLKTAAKVMSTGIVFIWNFLSRKLWIYRQS